MPKSSRSFSDYPHELQEEEEDIQSTASSNSASNIIYSLNSPSPPPSAYEIPRFAIPRFNSKYTDDNDYEGFRSSVKGKNKKALSLNDLLPNNPNTLTPPQSRSGSRVYSIDNTLRQGSLRPVSPSNPTFLYQQPNQQQQQQQVLPPPSQRSHHNGNHHHHSSNPSPNQSTSQNLNYLNVSPVPQTFSTFQMDSRRQGSLNSAVSPITTDSVHSNHSSESGSSINATLALSAATNDGNNSKSGSHSLKSKSSLMGLNLRVHNSDSGKNSVVSLKSQAKQRKPSRRPTTSSFLKLFSNSRRESEPTSAANGALSLSPSIDQTQFQNTSQKPITSTTQPQFQNQQMHHQTSHSLFHGRVSDPTDKNPSKLRNNSENPLNIPHPTRGSDSGGNIFNFNLKNTMTDIKSISNVPDAAPMGRGGSTASAIDPLSKSNSAPYWKAPESWKVKPTIDEIEFFNDHYNSNSTLSRKNTSNTTSDLNSSSSDSVGTIGKSTLAQHNHRSSNSKDRMDRKDSEPLAVHHHHAELKGASKSSVRIFKADQSTVLACSLDTTIQYILDQLKRKRFVKTGDDYNYNIVLKYGGLTRTLSPDERPLKIQRTLLFFYGYTERDNLDYIERTDLSFLFQFIVEQKKLQLIPIEKQRLINPTMVDLKYWNLTEIPNFLFWDKMISLDVSQNPSFEFTGESMHECISLKVLKFASCGSRKFPLPVVYTPRLEELDLQVNYIKYIPPDISFLKTLTVLNLACNRIAHLPLSFAELQSLHTLNLSSNRIEDIPEPLMKLKNLRNLDLSYNVISVISPNLVNLVNLEMLQLAANKLSKNLPDFFESFSSLIKIDLRFNKLDSIDSLRELHTLEVIRATGNNISVFTSAAKMLYELELNINPLTLITFQSPMRKLKTIDFSKGALTTCSFFKFLPRVDTLLLDHNKITSLSDDICLMKNLTHLSIFKNKLMALPESIGKLKKLSYLDVHLNNISKLTDKVWLLDSLETLNVSTNVLESFPNPPTELIEFSPVLEKNPTMSSDTSLLDVSGNADDSSNLSAPLVIIETASTSSETSRGAESTATSKNNNKRSLLEEDPIERGKKMGLAKSLKVLSMGDNKLTDSVIRLISVFKNLEILNLSYNEILEIPAGYIYNLGNLRSLYLSGNRLRSLPIDELDVFKQLTTLHLNGNSFTSLPTELCKIVNLSALDAGSNLLKYNIANIAYDWNWFYNKKLKYLNLSGNKLLEIKPQHKRDGTEEPLDSFLVLDQLRFLGLMDVTITTDAVPDESVDVRVRSTASQMGKFGYGISDTLGDGLHLTTRDVVIEKFGGKSDEMLIAIYDGKNCSETHGDKISKIIQETFEIHLAKELENIGKSPGADHPAKNVEDCLRGAFLTMNSEMNILINRDKSSTFSSAAAHRTTTTDELTLEEDGLTGCAATIVYVRGDYIYIANLGDTMGIVTKSDGQYDIITTKHEPYAPEEYERIRESGGFVNTEGYLDGVAIVSRAVGYFKLIPHVNASPSIHKFRLTSNEETIALASSEVWKKIPFGVAADIVRKNKSNPEVAAAKLRDYAISYGTTDKATAVVLSLRQFISAKPKKHYERSSTSHHEDITVRNLEDEIPPPTGEVAMVFTDIKNSTLLWDTHQMAMRSAIKVHNDLMRRQLRVVGGYEVKTEGDAFMVSFPTATSALLWCFQIQSMLLSTDEWPAEILQSDQGCEVKDDQGTVVFRGLSVRMGIHWGKPVCEEDPTTKRMDYFGPMVNRAARVSAVADGGQITISSDFHSEFEKLKEMHKKVKDGSKISSVYQDKELGELIETHMNTLDQIGLIEEGIGSRKLKGLETPEKIWLVLPKHLGSRLKVLTTTNNGRIENKGNKLIAGITSETVWKLRLLSLRLEKICSFLSNEELKVVVQNSSNKRQSKFLEDVDKHLDNALDKETDLMTFLDHLVTRIENCVNVLALRKCVTMLDPSATGLVRSDMDALCREMISIFGELKGIRG